MTSDERDRLDRLQADDDTKAVLSTPQGRRFMWNRLIIRSGMFTSPLINEGKRDFGVELYNEIVRKFPELFLIMQTEAINHEERRKQEIEADDRNSNHDY